MDRYDELEIKDMALKLWENIKPQMESVIRKISGFNLINSKEDYEHTAYLACYQAILEYRKLRTNNEKITKMKLETFAYWYLLKRIHKAADTGEVGFVITDVNEKNWIFNNGDFRRLARDIRTCGFDIQSVNIMKSKDEDEDMDDAPDEKEKWADKIKKFKID